MAETSYPVAGGAGVNEYTYELLMANAMAVGRVEPFFHETTSIDPLVYADSTGRQIKIMANAAYIIRGYRWESGAEGLILPLNANTSGKSRTDVVVLRLDRSTYTIRAAVLPGVPSDTASPPSPTVNGGASGVYEVPIAQVTVKSQSGTGLPSIAAGDVRLAHEYLQPRGVVGHSMWHGNNTPIGQVYHEWDTGKMSMGAVGGDVLVGENSAWTKLAASGGWTLDNIYAQRVNGWTHFQCYITLNVADRPPSTDMTVCVLPDQFRPKRDFFFQCFLTPYQLGLGYVDSSAGTVKVTAYGQTFPTNGKLIIGPVSYPSKGVKG